MVLGMMPPTLGGPRPAGPYGSATEPVELRNRAGAVIRGAVHRPLAAGPPELVVLAVAGLGEPMRRTLSPALYLLAAGYTVVRFDPTNSVGRSEGPMLDFTPARLADDIVDVGRWAAERWAPCEVAVYGCSVSARASLRAAAQAPGLFAAVGTLCCVVDLRATLHAIHGTDLVGRYCAPDAPEVRGTVSLLGHEVRAGGVRTLLHGDWVTLESARRDLAAAAGTRFVNVHGGRDPYVRTGDARSAFALPNADLRVVPDAGHHFAGRHRDAALGMLVEGYRAAFGQPWRPAARTGSDRCGLEALKAAEAELDHWWRTVPDETGGR
ncbi:alpha/beta hydrolase family protein [Allonocardiopsis opalescens]|uniref:Acyl transferase n=1 Tax=Allonocardiopsis opalescens TaxID=1144618 RepID=A0A2T0QCN2_9ACTN|nr:CocE/NonD family hydrolase [Allonocardiopsis opalescens]PRY01630.1 acyl transferase [Allonocardiopsis opalescens]